MSNQRTANRFRNDYDEFMARNHKLLEEHGAEKMAYIARFGRQAWDDKIAAEIAELNPRQEVNDG